MRPTTTIQLAIAVCLVSCGDAAERRSMPCTLVGCPNRVSVTATGTMATPLSAVSGTASMDGQVIVGECPLVTGPTGSCADSSIKFDGIAESQGAIELDLQDGDGRRFRGTVQPSYRVDENFNGPGCGTCTWGSVAVTLQ